MKAIKYSGYGDSSVIKISHLDLPQINSNEILIKMHASSVSPSDVVMRKGQPFIARFFTGLFKPKIVPGDLVSGTIESIGSEVVNFEVGDRVFGSAGDKMWAHAEFLKIKASEAIVKLPTNLSFEEGSALSDGAITAYPFLTEVGHIQAGHHVLINGGSGSVGSYAIQIAKHLGATVTAVSSSKNIGLLESLGADYTIDYNKDDFTSNANTYDIIFDVVGKSSYGKCKTALSSTGRYLSTFPTVEILFRSLFNGITKKKCHFAATGLRKPSKKIADYKILSTMASTGTLKTIIDRSYTFEDIKEAHDYVELGHKVGNVILTINK